MCKLTDLTIIKTPNYSIIINSKYNRCLVLFKIYIAMYISMTYVLYYYVSDMYVCMFFCIYIYIYICMHVYCILCNVYVLSVEVLYVPILIINRY